MAEFRQRLIRRFNGVVGATHRFVQLLNTVRIAAAGLLFTVLFTPVVWGQQTIFDVPSADVSERHDYFYQHQTVARAWSPERQWVQTNAFGFGLGSHLEWDLTQFNFDPRHPKEVIGSTGMKASLPLTPESSRVPTRFVVGDMIQFGAANDRHVGNWSYAMLNVALPVTQSRLTGGFHHGTSLLFGERTHGFLGGIEQPLSARWMLQGDWISGRHDLGYWIPGIVYRPVRHWMISLGYQIPNRRSPGYRAIVFELTRI